MKKTLIYSLFAFSFLFLSCIKRDKMMEPKTSNSVMTKTGDDMLVIPKKETLKTGTFESYAHSLSGNVTVIKDTTGNVILRLENYTMTPGPDVDVYLSKTSSYSKSNVFKIDHLVDGYSNATRNIDIANDSDLATYKYVLVWCVAFDQLFGYAELK
jgi:hypothetical protein